MLDLLDKVFKGVLYLRTLGNGFGNRETVDNPKICFSYKQLVDVSLMSKRI